MAALSPVALLMAAPDARSADKSDPEPGVVRGVKLRRSAPLRRRLRGAERNPQRACGRQGALAGAVVGGLAVHGVGGGSGRTAATVIGAIGGGLAGNAIDKKMNRVTVWTTTVVFKDGTVLSYERDSGPSVEPGDIVAIAEGRPARVER